MKDQHALCLEGFRHIFLERMPLLRPEAMSMTALNLFTCLCSLAKVANSSLKKPIDDDLVNTSVKSYQSGRCGATAYYVFELQINGMDMLWKIALRAQNTEVSLNAIQHLNNHYINCKSPQQFTGAPMDSAHETN